jgi:hypothetical protein
MLICLCISYGCYHAKTLQLSSYTTLWFTEPKTLTLGPLQKNFANP